MNEITKEDLMEFKKVRLANKWTASDAIIFCKIVYMVEDPTKLNKKQLEEMISVMKEKTYFEAIINR